MRHSQRGIVLGVMLCLLLCAVSAHGAEEAANDKAAVAAKAAAAARAEKEVKARKAAAAQKPRKKKPPAAAVAVEEAVEEVVADVIIMPNGQVMQRKQVRSQFTQLFKVELAYARRVCDLTPEQCRQVAADAVAVIDRVMKKYGRNKNRRNRGGVFANGQPALSPNERDLVQAEVKKIVTPQLRPEQAARYLEELTKRDEQFRNSAAQFFVARIDDKLRLSDEQRKKLLESLLEEWREPYGRTMEILVHNHQYVPQISSKPILAILDDNQKNVWRTLPKLGPQNVSVFFTRGGNNALVDDFELPDEQAQDGPEPKPGAVEANGR